jgi:hypothetical protein
MPEVGLLPLIERITMMLAELPIFADTFGASENERSREG